MQTLAIIAFGVVDLVVFSVVLTALIWAAVKDGQKQQRGAAERADRVSRGAGRGAAGLRRRRRHVTTSSRSPR